MHFQKLQQCEAVTNLSVAGNATYTSRSAGQEFQTCLARDIHEQVVGNIKNSQMYTILIDESTDIAICKHMVIYIRIVDQSFLPHTYFLKNVTIDNPKSDTNVLFGYMQQTLQDDGLDLSKVIGFGSDGASVMVGKTHSVSALLKKKSPHCINIHCMAHRLSLASSQASRNIPFMKEVEATLTELYKYFGRSKSGNRKCELEEIQKILEDPVLKIKECHEIRWLAFFDAVRTVFVCWRSLHAYFSSNERSSSKATEILEMIQQYKFLAVLAMLMDILPAISHLCVIMQKQDLDIACVRPAVDNLLEKVKMAKKGTTHYQSELKEQLKKTTNDAGRIVELEYRKKKLVFTPSLKEVSKEFSEIRFFLRRLDQEHWKQVPS